MSQRVVVTGMGIVSPIGRDLDSYWEGLSNGVSGGGPITLFDASDYATHIACEVKDFDPTAYMDFKEAKRADRFVQFAIAATDMALEHSGLTIDDSNADRVGIFIGSGVGGMSTWEREFEKLLTRGPDRVSPFLVPMMIANMAAGMVSIRTGARGPNAALVTACASGSHAIGDAYEIIKRGDADAMIAGGSEAAVTRVAVAGFCAAGAISRHNEDPKRASRPFDANRDGFVIGEGAGLLILESLEGARARGAPILAEIIGYGMSGDAHHVTAPAVHGAARAMQEALRTAGVEPDEIDYVNAHAPGTLAGDASECMALTEVFGARAREVPVSATKSMIGHLLGAAGAAELIATILAMQHGVIPPTINYETPDPECDLDVVPNEARPAKVVTALSNSFGFGGQNASIVVRKYES